MLVLILLWWVFIQISAPTWCYVCLVFAMFLKCLGAFIDMIKAIVDAYDKAQENKKK